MIFDLLPWLLVPQVWIFDGSCFSLVKWTTYWVIMINILSCYHGYLCCKFEYLMVHIFHSLKKNACGTIMVNICFVTMATCVTSLNTWWSIFSLVKRATYWTSMANTRHYAFSIWVTPLLLVILTWRIFQATLPQGESIIKYIFCDPC